MNVFSEVWLVRLSIRLFFLPSIATAHRAPGPPHSQGFLMTLNDTSHSVGLLWTSDRPVKDNTQHSKQTHMHASSGLRTRNPRKRSVADYRLRPLVHWVAVIECSLSCITCQQLLLHAILNLLTALYTSGLANLLCYLMFRCSLYYHTEFCIPTENKLPIVNSCCNTSNCWYFCL